MPGGQDQLSPGYILNHYSAVTCKGRNNNILVSSGPPRRRLAADLLVGK